MALADNALLTAAEVRAALKVSEVTLLTADAEALANSVSDRWETETGRRLKGRVYTARRINGTGRPHLPGLDWPITAIASVLVDGVAQTVWMPGDPDDPKDHDVILEAHVDPKQGPRALYRRLCWPVGVMNITITYTAGYGATGFPIPTDLLYEGLFPTIRHFYYAADRQSTNVSSRSTGDGTITYAQAPLPVEALPVLRAYKQWRL